METVTNPYDEVPYDNLAFAQTHPDRLAAIASLFGLQPPAVGSCRVLELGCASGGNLIPMAFNLPDGRFVGIDLSRRQIECGCQTIQAVGIPNAELRHASILDVTREWGEFDYIICHGVFSWVERPVQDAILRIAAENLSPAGVAYVSYNTYPGWHMREVVRDMMRYHTGQFDTPRERIEQARELLAFLVAASHESGAYGELLAREAERLSHTSDAYLYHEHLEQTNTPCYFHQFIARAEAAGLTYLSEASVGEMLTSQFPPEVAATLERVSPDILHLEQYMDFVRNRLFRQTLLVHSTQRPLRALAPAAIEGLLVSCAATPETTPVDLDSATRVTFRSGGQRADVSLPTTKAAMALLWERWPGAVPVAALREAAMEQAAPHLGEMTAADAERGMMGDLFRAVLSGIVNLHTHPPNCTSRVSERPRANRLAAFEAGNGARVENAHHQVCALDPLSVELLRLLDGQHTLADVVAMLLPRLADGSIVIEDASRRVVDPEAARAVLTRQVEERLRTLSRAAILVA